METTPIVIAGMPVTDLPAYATVPIAFTVRSTFDVTESGEHPDDFVLNERPVETPYIKDYDALDGGPARWAERRRAWGRRWGGMAYGARWQSVSGW